MNINDLPFLPNYVENNGELYYMFPTGQLQKVDEQLSEIPIQSEIEIEVGHDYDFLRHAFWDKRFPFERFPCTACGNALTRLVISNKQNVHVCECGNINLGRHIS